MDRQEKKLIILMADDDEDDRMFVRDALRGQPVDLQCVSDGMELMQYLYCRGDYKAVRYPRPDLILLDLNMPRKDGRQVLIEIKSDPRLKAIPVIILTTSKEECDVNECYLHGANCYLVKPMTFDRLVEVLKCFHVYWEDISALPSIPPPESCIEDQPASQ